MKKLLFAAALTMLTLCSHAQDKPVKDTIINSVTYKIYVGPKGGRFIWITSKKGTKYKRYLPALPATKPQPVATGPTV